MIAVTTQRSSKGFAVPVRSSSPIVSGTIEEAPSLGASFDLSITDSLLDVLARVVDPRKRRGRRYLLASILAVASAATLAGARSFMAIGEWAADASPSVLSRLGICRGAPSEKAIRACLQRLAPDALDQVLGSWMWLRTSMIDGRRVIAFDGKTLEGARDAAGNLTHLPAGICQSTGAVLARIAVPGKTNEVPMLRKLLATLDIAGAVVTADALHTTRETAADIIARGAHYILTVKGNQPKLRKTLKALPWSEIPESRRSTETGSGRRDTRVSKAAGIAEGIGFPGAAQVLRLKRTRTNRKTGKRTTETVYAVTSLSIADAKPQQVATWLRRHWWIENRVHWVRDVVFAEDKSQVRTAAGPQVMATLRNLVLSLLRLAGHANIAAALRHHAADHERPLALLLTC